MEISIPLFYHIVWEVIGAILAHPELDICLPSLDNPNLDKLQAVCCGFEDRSTKQVMKGCAGDLDG
jgi:hypothetical protein